MTNIGHNAVSCLVLHCAIFRTRLPVTIIIVFCSVEKLSMFCGLFSSWGKIDISETIENSSYHIQVAILIWNWKILVWISNRSLLWSSSILAGDFLLSDNVTHKPLYREKRYIEIGAIPRTGVMRIQVVLCTTVNICLSLRCLNNHQFVCFYMVTY